MTVMHGDGAHPYKNLPEHCFWHKAMSSVPPFAVDPVVDVPFKIRRSTLVATGGSCFAQHMGRVLKENECSYYAAECPPDTLPTAERLAYNYGVFSARYGNIYTARQLLQLFDRAHGLYAPQISVWQTPTGTHVDPFRPRIQPGGYSSIEQLNEDRNRHLAAVRQMFATLEVFIFTLGLTESWEHVPDGATLPLPPGVAGGVWQPEIYRFRNFSVREVEEDLLTFIDRLRNVNPTSRVILTVSPVPLAATYVDQHVLVSTCLSKSTLRVAAQTCSQTRDNVAYFPAYEIITGPHSGGSYYDDDLRSITDKGVNHVMRTFFRHYIECDNYASGSGESEAARYATAELQSLKDVICDEESLAT